MPMRLVYNAAMTSLAYSRTSLVTHRFLRLRDVNDSDYGMSMSFCV